MNNTFLFELDKKGIQSSGGMDAFLLKEGHRPIGMPDSGILFRSRYRLRMMTG